MAVDHLDNLIALTSDGTAITESADGYDLWATQTGRHIGAFPTVLDIRRTAVVHEDRLIAYAKGWRQSYDLLRANWSPTSAPRPGVITPKRSADASCPRAPPRVFRARTRAPGVGRRPPTDRSITSGTWSKSPLIAKSSTETTPEKDDDGGAVHRSRIPWATAT